MRFRTIAAFVFATASVYAQENAVRVGGEPVIVRDVSFAGNKAFSADILTPLLQTQASSPGVFRFLFFLNTYYLDPIAIAQDSIALNEFYRQNGFFFNKITPHIAVDSGGATAAVTFTIAEGAAATVDTIVVPAFGALPPSARSQLPAIFGPLKGTRFSRTRLMDSIASAFTFLHNNGYREARLAGSPDVRLEANLRTVAITVPAVVGPRYYFGRVDIQYDSASRDRCFAEEAVLQELEFKEGDLYSAAKLDKSKENLIRLGVFQDVRIELQTQYADSATRRAPVIIHLNLRKILDFSPDFVANNDYGTFNIGLSAAAVDHNLGCAGQELSLTGSYEIQDFTLNKNRTDGQLKFLQPRIRLGDILSYRRTSLQAMIGYTKTTYPIKQTILSAATLLSIREAEYTYLIPQIAFVEAQTSYDSAHAYLFNTANPQAIQKQPNLLASVSVTRDNTNNLFVPSRGSSGVLTLKTNLLATPYFSKAEGTQKWYVAWGTQSVFAFRLHGGLIERYGGNAAQDILFDEKFYVGGAYSMRGWQLYQLGLGVDTAGNERTGYTLFEANAEWRYKWFLLPDTWFNRVLLNRLSHDVFIDIGNIWGERKKWEWVKQMPQQLAVAVGFGLRYDTPVGPVRLDLGYKLYDPYTQSFQHLASFDGRWPFMHLVHPQLQIALGNAF